MTWPRLLRRVPFVVAYLVTIGCSFIVDTSDVDGGCEPDEKVCGGRCVRIDDPAYGCLPVDDACQPCDRADRGAISCTAENQCQVECLRPFQQCGRPDCDINVFIDPNNCGGCGLVCSRAGARCREGLCCTDDGVCEPGTPAPE